MDICARLHVLSREKPVCKSTHCADLFSTARRDQDKDEWNLSRSLAKHYKDNQDSIIFYP